MCYHTTPLGNTQALWEFTLSLTLVIYRIYTHTMGFSGGSDGKEPACNAGDLSSVPGLGRSPGERNANPLQYSCLGNPMDGEACWATVHGVTKSQTRLSDFPSLHFKMIRKME